MVPTFLTAEVAQAAETGQVARINKWLNEGGPVNARDVFQCSLLHLAAGAGQKAVVRELIRRGADLDDRMSDGTSAMGKTALHVACEQGQVEIIELLVAAGANTTLRLTTPTLSQQQMQLARRTRSGCGKAQRCCNSAFAGTSKSSRELCKTSAVRLALERPQWSKQNHDQWPDRFKAVVQQLLFLFLSHKRNDKEKEHVLQYCPLSSFSLSRRSGKTNTASVQEQGISLQLDWDTLQEIIQLLAYPISQWCDSKKLTDAAGSTLLQTQVVARRSRPKS